MQGPGRSQSPISGSPPLKRSDGRPASDATNVRAGTYDVRGVGSPYLLQAMAPHPVSSSTTNNPPPAPNLLPVRRSVPPMGVDDAIDQLSAERTFAQRSAPRSAQRSAPPPQPAKTFEVGTVVTQGNDHHVSSQELPKETGSSSWIRDLVQEKKQRSEDAVDRMKQRAEKVQRAREDLQARIKSIRSLVNSSTKSVNEISSPAAVERRLAGHSPTQRSLSPQSPSERHTSIPPQSVEWPPTPGNMSHVDDRPISLPSEYMKTKQFTVAAAPMTRQPMSEHYKHARPETPIQIHKLPEVSPQTPKTGIDRLDQALSAIDKMSINKFDGHGALAPDKSEIKADVVGAAGLKEQIWRIKQQKEALKSRAGDLLEGKIMFGSTRITDVERRGQQNQSFDASFASHVELSTTMNTTMNTTGSDLTFHKSPGQVSIHRSQTLSPSRDASSVGMRDSRPFDDMLPTNSVPGQDPSTKMASSVQKGAFRSHATGNLDSMHASKSQHGQARFVQSSSSAPGQQKYALQISAKANYPGEARAEFDKRISESAKGIGLQRVVGLQVPLATGLRVKPVDRALAHSKGGAGFITKINSDLDACFVKWDLTEEECGWYRCGAYGSYTLCLLPPDQENRLQVLDMMTTGGNSKKDIENRNMDYREKHGLHADNVIVSLFDMFGV